MKQDNRTRHHLSLYQVLQTFSNILLKKCLWSNRPALLLSFYCLLVSLYFFQQCWIKSVILLFRFFLSSFFVKFTKSDWWKLISVYKILASYWLVFLHHLNLKRGRFITSTATYSHLGFEPVKARVVDGLCIKDKED